MAKANGIVIYSLLCSLLTSLFSGCAYTWKGDTDWKFLRNTGDWKEESRETVKKSRVRGEIKELKRKYNIGDVSMDENILNIPVTETKMGGYDESQKEIIKINYVRDSMFYRKNPEKIDNRVRERTINGVLLGGLLGIVIGGYASSEENNLEGTGTLLGSFLGALQARYGAVKKCKTDQTELTCNFKKDVEYNTESQETISPTKRQKLETLAENEKSKETPVRLSSDYFKFKKGEKILSEILVYTKGDGIANSSIIIKDGTFSKDVLKEKIKQEFSSYIKPDYKSILDEFANSISPKRQNVALSTEVNSDKLEIVNASKNVSLEFYVLDQEAIDRAINAFVDKNINSNIREVKFSLRNIESHHPITGARLELKSNSPKPEEIVSKYFTGMLAEKALQYVKPYKINEAESYKDNTLRFSVYVPAEYSVEITHPDYKFINEPAIKFEEGKLDKIVDMVELGSKERKEDAEKKKGTITDK